MNILSLNNGEQLPQMGFGTFMIQAGPETELATTDALRAGFRYFDTAHAYLNERNVSSAFLMSGIPRNEFYISSKLWPSDYGTAVTRNAIDQMLQRLGLDYIDVLLLHHPFGNYCDAWKEMEDTVSEGKIRSLGLSNFEIEDLENILDIAKIPPAILQMECHPYFQQKQLKEFIAPYKIRLEAWFPLGHGSKKLLLNPEISKLGRKYGKSNSQIILRWHLQEEHLVIPKSVNSAHMKEDLDIFDFELSEEDMRTIQSLDRGKRFYTRSKEEQKKLWGDWVLKD